ncbi:MAG: HD domain-containing protein, partial [Myxococcota bacterium]|nr:HD domain-containing protein [Myxococcota bacterium]
IAFLEQIPWPRSLSNVTKIAGAHHEKLNGSGYPARLTEEQIPLESRIMTVADIYDALTAADRPYKKAVSAERALDILTMEARDHHVDKDLVELFSRHEVYNVNGDTTATSSSQ